MNHFDAKTRKEIDRQKYLRHRDAILKRNAEYRGLTPESRAEFNLMRRVKEALKDRRESQRAYWSANSDAINARRRAKHQAYREAVK